MTIQSMLVLFLFLISLLGGSEVIQLDLSTSMTIYGVRWFLAESFRYPDHLSSSSSQADLMAMFNTFQEHQNLTFELQIDNQIFSCNKKRVSIQINETLHHEFNNLASSTWSIFTTFIFKCPIRFQIRDFLTKSKDFNYFIHLKNSTKREVVFHATLKSPLFGGPDIKAITIGDWGKITKSSPYYDFLQPIDKCLQIKINEQNPNFMIILGDVGYDMQGDTYIDFLLYLQPYSSRLAILFTPGNHQTSKHQSIYPLVMETFYSPYWSQFYGYFDIAMIGNHAIVGYNPDSLFRKSLFSLLFENKYKEHIQILDFQLTSEIKNALASEYTVISISHYPIYCSEDDIHNNCSFHLESQARYLELLQSLKTDLFIGAHLHFYERSKAICNREGSIIQPPVRETSETSFHLGKTCPIHIVEGSAGNNYFVQTELEFPLKNFSEKFIPNTGFGILTLFNSVSNQTINYRHFTTANQCSKADDFIFLKNFSSEQKKIVFLFDSTQSAIVVLILMVIIFHLISCYIKNRKIGDPPKQVRSHSTMELSVDSSR